MNKQKWFIIAVTLALIGVTASLVNWLRVHQRLGVPGIKAETIPGQVIVKIALPEHVLDYTSTNLPQSERVLEWLPPDTSYAQRLYTAPDGFNVNANIVLMGMDRTSIHRPEICLPAQGGVIREQTVSKVRIQGPQPYDMPIAKWVLSEAVPDGRGGKIPISGIFIFWFVADNEQTVSHGERMWWLARDLLKKGVLQRWAYVVYYARCLPGEEDATFDRMTKLIGASVPQFQYAPRTLASAAPSPQSAREQ